ncbi:MFS transporter [Microbacterium gorillae]|uniref:MFS transporter n=1 Tax=Microbacterium gorillae TaxID=1231063 RepID=UPI000591326E|nr:MFS transporter [Microbacterium gorillae]
MTNDTQQAEPATDGVPTTAARQGMRWTGLLAMLATSFVLVTAEFLPSGILTPMAASWGVTPGQAGQTVTVTAVVGFIVAPTIAAAVPRLDRRRLLIILALLAMVSNLVVAIAPDIWVALAARVLLGAALSGFWAMSLTVAATLASPERIGKAMAVVTLGTSVATIAGVPIGVAVSMLADWRYVFIGAAVLSLAVAIVLRLALPRVPASAGTGLGQLWDTLRRPGIASGLAGHVLVVLGQITAYTFMRVALERVDGLDAAGIAAVLVLFGVGGFLGNLLIGLLVDRRLAVLAFVVPLLLAASVATVAFAPGSLVAVAVAVTLWGAGFGGWLVIVNTWLGRVVPDRLEAGGGLVVAGFQLAITIGAALGGLLVDSFGVTVTFVAAAGVLVVGAVLFGRAVHGVTHRCAG